MSLTYAGVPLLMEDPGHKLQSWIERSLSLDDMRIFGSQPVAASNGRTGARGTDGAYSVGLGTYNSSAPPRWKINSLWIPTGAARWAQGLFLCRGANIAAVHAGLTSSGSAIFTAAEQRITGASTVARTLSYYLYLLPPRCIAAAASEEALWLLPLVDKRYFWQFRDFGYHEVTVESTWESLIAYCAGRLGTTISYAEIAAAYIGPDTVELTRHHENLAMLLDAIAASVGMRCVFDLSAETLEFQDTSAANVLYAANLTANSGILAGGTSSGLSNYVPSAVKVVFPKYRNGLRDADGDVYSVEKAADDYTTSSMQDGTTKVFYDSCDADMSGVYENSSPNNADELDDLAGQITSDYYAWLARVYDVTYVGMGLWSLTGFDDYIWFHFGSQYADAADDPSNSGDYACCTRIASMPYNYGISQLLHAATPQSSASAGSSSTSSGSSGYGQFVVQVVSDVCCDGNDIIVCYTDLHFDSNGRLTNVDVNAGGCDC